MQYLQFDRQGLIRKIELLNLVCPIVYRCRSAKSFLSYNKSKNLSAEFKNANLRVALDTSNEQRKQQV